MPFEPLRTDEKLETPVPRTRDMDAVLLAGCTGFVLTSIGSFLLSAWPFFAMPDLLSLASLTRTCLIGLVPAAIVGLLATRRFGLPGACGFFAGSMATAIFFILRLQQVFLLGQTRDDLLPAYPMALVYVIALAWLVGSALLALIAMPRGELGSFRD
jgi:hypothetical protein